MFAIRMRQWPLGTAVLVFAISGTTARFYGQEAASPSDIQAPQETPSPDAVQAESRPAHFIVLRLSSAMLNAQIDRQIDVQVPVSDVILGTPVSGVARITGQPKVVLEPSFDQARFVVSVSGTVYSRTVGRSGPATVYGRSITQFTATRPIIFEPGKGFHAGAPRIATHTQVYTDRIDINRRGIIGRIIQRRAWEQVNGQRAQVTAIARQRASTRIAAAMEKHLTERLARLNEAIEFRTIVAGLRDQAEGTPQVVCCTTPEYVEIADTLARERSTIVLPVLSSASDAKAPIEVWIHQRVLPEGAARVLQSVVASPDQNEIIQTLALLPGPLGKEAAAGLTTFVSQNQIGVQTLGEWTVLEITTPRAPKLAAAESLHR